MNRPTIPWPPPRHLWPRGFSVHRDGWARSYRGRTIVISGKRRTAKDVQQRFEAKCKTVDVGTATMIPSGTMVTLREMTSAFFAAMDRRIKRDTFRERSLVNLQQETNRFGKFIGGHRLLSTIGPDDFARYYAKYLDGRSPNTIGSAVARISTMFRWGVKNGLVDRVIFGDDWRKPQRRQLMARRVRTEKRFTPDEIAAMWKIATPMWRCWIALGVIACFTNADLANLPRDIVSGNVIDYRRRKTGETRRVIVLPDEVVAVLDTYRRPTAADPRYEGHFFLNHLGIPFDTAPHTSQSCEEFRALQEAAGIYRKGRSVTGLRTTGFNLMLNAPPLTRGLIMGRKPENMSAVDWENYCEHVDHAPIAELTRATWSHFKTPLSDEVPAAVPARRAASRRSPTASGKRSRRG